MSAAPVAVAAPGLPLETRLGATAVVVAAALVVAWLVVRKPGPIGGWSESRAGLLAVLVALAGFAATAAAALVVVWDVVDPTLAMVDAVQVGTATIFRALVTLALLALAYVASGILKRVIEEFTSGREQISRHQSEIIYRMVQLSVYVVVVLVALGLWDVDLGGFLIGAGFLGIIIGMAARQTLGAMLAGFVLMFSRPFEIGDWVEIDDDEGIVTDITIVNTRIQTFDGEYVVLPNDKVSGSTITNRTRKGRLRLRVEVGVDYEADVERAADVARETMSDLDDVLSVPTPSVVLRRFGDSAVVLELRFWIDKPSARRKWRARTAVITAVKRAFEAEGIKIPFPQRELLGREEAGGLRLSGEPSVEREQGSERDEEQTGAQDEEQVSAADGGEQ